MQFKFYLVLLLIIVSYLHSYSWGFYAHKKINRIAIFSLPKEMFSFYKIHIDFITDKATAPDKRRYILKEEATRHYIDFEDYGDSAIYKLPHSYFKLKEYYPDDSLLKFGIVPWHIQRVCYQLTEAFKSKNTPAILRISADLGHYIADANVPLHTTKNYNGQLTNQVGIHGFWESRLPELFSNQYDLFTGKAIYINSIHEYSWQMVVNAHSALDSVLNFEKILDQQFPSDKKFSYEQRGSVNLKVYSKSYSKAYHHMLSGQVERQMRAAIKSTAALWYTCWINAGQPDLNQFIDKKTYIEEDTVQSTPLNELEIRPEAHLFLEEFNSCSHHHDCCEEKNEIVADKRKWWMMFLVRSER